MANDGSVVFEIVGDPSKINQTVKQVTNNIEQESKKWDDAVDDSTDKMESSFLSMKTVAAAAVGAIGAALVKFGREAIDSASDLAEVQNVVDTVFGDGARVIENWSQKAGEKFGLTEIQAKRFTSTLGAMMKSSGLAGKEIIGMSTDLAGLAADMASFYNLDFETAFEKIRSGISGETMPLKQLGINMSVANLEAFALAQGLEKTFQQMDQGEQTMLRYQYLMQATADAQGDFEKTADGFANAQRRILSSLESIKTSVGRLIIEPYANATAGVADFLAKIASDMMPEKTVIDEFNDAKIESDEKLAELQETYNSASDLIKILKEIEAETVTLQNGSSLSLGSLFGELGEIEKSGGSIQEYIQSLGLDVDYVVLEYNKWKEATRQLTSLVPSLTNVIDNETGAIEGGTDALQKNLDEWKKNEENKIYWAEYYAKAEAVARAKGEQAGLQLTARARQLALERYAKEFADKYDLSISADGEPAGNFSNQTILQNYIQYEEDLSRYYKLRNAAREADEKAKNSADDLSEAESLLADELAAVEEITGETLETQKKESQQTEELIEDTKELSGAWDEAAKALQAVSNYYKNVYDSTEQAVNSTLKGFEKITVAYNELQQSSSDLAGEETEVWNTYGDVLKKYGSTADEIITNMQARQKEAEKSKDKTKKLSDEELEAYEALVKVKKAQDEVNDSMKQYQPEGITKSLQSQITFMEDYIKNLNQLKEWGVSEELIASLADGSEESASYLQGLVDGGEEAAKEVGGLFDEVAQKKAEFTKELTDTKLQADKAYQDLVDAATNALSDLNLHDSAKASLAETVQGIADGIDEKLPAVQQAVNAVIAELDRLNSYGISYNFDAGGAIEVVFGNATPLATGSNWIPYDNFPALLHQGEAVLTAEENQIWQMFKNGHQPGSVDYDALGGVMRENVKAGGNVYLDGRTVGHVISDQQAKTYRNLQRSGWQG